MYRLKFILGLSIFLTVSFARANADLDLKILKESYNSQLDMQLVQSRLVDHRIDEDQDDVTEYEKFNRSFLLSLTHFSEALRLESRDRKANPLPTSLQLGDLRWRRDDVSIEITKLSDYDRSKKLHRYFNTNEARQAVVHLSQNYTSNYGGVYMGMNPANTINSIFIKVGCDQPWTLRHGLSKTEIPARKMHGFELLDSKTYNDVFDLILNSETNACRVVINDALSSKKNQNGFMLVNEKNILKERFPEISKIEICELPQSHTSLTKNSLLKIEDPLSSVFFNNKYLNMTCPNTYDRIRFMDQPIDSLQVRAEILLGQRLSPKFIADQNPNAPLDFSKAPKLDAILVSYLVFRADFYGTVLSRLLEFHAKRGALVRIMASDVITLDKDRLMYERLVNSSDNIKVTLYKYDVDAGGGNILDQLHRVNHIKMFLTYSRNHPELSSAIVGGRNVHDGFALEKPNLKAKPSEDVISYGDQGDESWAFWRDFEMKIEGQTFVQQLIAHYFAFYQMDKDTMVMRVPSLKLVNNKLTVPEGVKQIRHYISSPFKDDINLIQFYVDLIDSAQKYILLSSPYFRPVKEVGEALERAQKRGIKIKLITRLNLKGDTADLILSDVNKEGVNQFYKSLEIFEYIVPNEILHSKLLMIDGKMSFVGSVNLNKRSFYHDLENGVLIKDADFTRDLEKIYNGYLNGNKTKKVSDHLKVPLWKKLIIGALDKEF